MDIMTMILTNQPIHYLGQKYQERQTHGGS